MEPVGSHDSEGLLRAPALAPARIAGRGVLIVRGEGGREHLATELMARGASVDYAEVYRRRRPQGLDPAVASGCDIVTVTSSEGLANLLAVLDEPARAHVLARPLAVTSERIAARAREHGFTWPPRVAPEPGDAGLLQAIRRCVAALPEGPSEPA
ncbi:MAG: uroporphyrinogen-III synthase [Halofilum sp. (in: g-proteobacteria)]|nr:uroporphyrinogen-III synthase [Halofilum sp. (in: g-proteobacteria)]